MVRMSELKKHIDGLRSKSVEDLRTVLVDSKEELFNLKFQQATGNLENHRNIRKAKKEIARVHTLIREKELEQAREGVKK